MSTGNPRPALGPKRSIQRQILLAFLAMSIITASLGFFSVRDIERQGTLVDRTFDRSLMSINFARAASADFNALQAAVARRAMAKDVASRTGLENTIRDLESTMADDLSISVERAQSDRVVSAARKVQEALTRWKTAQAGVALDATSTKLWADLDRQAATVAQELDLLINYTAGDGFTYRQSAHATIQNDRRFNIVATLLAILISGSIAWLLARRILRPIKTASQIAEKIAEGDLGMIIPTGNADELGALLAAMEVMRGNIKASMEREIDLRQSAQIRLAEALDGSFEGIVVIDAKSKIVLANLQASRLLDSFCEPLRTGESADRLVARLAREDDDTDFDLSSTWEVEIDAGRWLRVSQSDTHDGGSVFVYSDISLLKAQQADLKSANFWLDAALGNLSHGLCLADADNNLRVFNKRLCELFSITQEQVGKCKTISDLVALGTSISGEALEDLQLRLARRIDARVPFDGIVGTVKGRTLAVSHRPLDNNCWIATYEDVTDRLQAADKIAHMARHDALTDLPNRAFFAERIETALLGADRGDGFALLCLDLDHFKEVNDTLGHPIGDELLRTVAERLRGAVRATDTVARLGGDEFAILQTGIKDPDEVLALAHRVIASLNAPCRIEGNPVSIGVSIGISLAPEDGHRYDKLLKNADMALYRAKADGRNGARFFERAMDERQQARRLLELDLREALLQNQFELEYQPVCDVAEDRITGFEALVRWRHPTRGLVSPSDFIPVAEEMGLITQIGDWVLHRACRDAVLWPGDISVAVNVSAAQLRHGVLHETVVAALERAGLAPGRLVLEITETVLIANPQNALLVLDRFKAMGIRIALDDFGTGYSSLSYLRSFPFDYVKIDKSFISDMTMRPEAAAIVRAVIALGASLGMRTIAEGIETESQLAFLKVEGCHEAQGFFFSIPIPEAAVPELIETQLNLTTFFGSPQAA